MIIHKILAKAKGFKPVDFISFTERVLPTKNSVRINNLFADKTIILAASRGKMW